MFFYWGPQLGDNVGSNPTSRGSSIHAAWTTLAAWANRKLEPFVGEKPSNHSEILLDCDRFNDQQFLTCLGNQRTLNYAIKNDPHLTRIFSDRRELLQNEESLKNSFRKDGDYQRIFDQLSVDTLYKADSGVTEGYSVGFHTTMALLIYETQKTHFRLSEIQVGKIVMNLDRFMKYLVAFHDIGKGFSAAIYPSVRRNRDEIIFSYPIAWRMMLNCCFSEGEAKLAILLIHVHKIIGDNLLGKISTEIAAKEFASNATIAGVGGDVFFRLAEILFVADAGSYPALRPRIFLTHEQTGKLTPKDQSRIEELRKTIINAAQIKSSDKTIL
ncbi:MAG: hypothetical protein IPK04_14460 [Bdellovibrionales bacterium]|nr:hypothetical protein [Bdellovibrionales bacterium]